MQISYTEFHPNKTNNVDGINRSSFTPLSKDGFRCANFHKSRSCSMILYEIFLYWILSQSEKCVHNKTKFILCSTAKYSFHCTIFTSLTHAQRHYIEIFYTKFHPLWRNMKITSINLFLHLNKIWLSLNLLSENSLLTDNVLYRIPVSNFTKMWQVV